VFGGKSDALREFVREYFEDHENEVLQLRSPSTNASESRSVRLPDLPMSIAGRCGIFSVNTALNSASDSLTKMMQRTREK
jgi:hypothetical protein